MRRLRFPLALLALAAAALALPAAGGAVKIPKGFKAPKVTAYPVTIDAVGYLEHRWTFDSTGKCEPGYAKTLEETLTFELGRPQAARVSVVNGKTVLFPVTAGSAVLQTELSGWQTTNFCPPSTPVKEPKEPTCKKTLRSKLILGLAPVREESGDLTPLSRGVQVAAVRRVPTPQNPQCADQRPRIEADSEASKGWMVDPTAGIVAPLGADNWDFQKLGIGKTLKRTVAITGGCRRASFGTGAGASRLPSTIKSCVVKGKIVVMVKRTGRGFGT